MTVYWVLTQVPSGKIKRGLLSGCWTWSRNLTMQFFEQNKLHNQGDCHFKDKTYFRAVTSRSRRSLRLNQMQPTLSKIVFWINPANNGNRQIEKIIINHLKLKSAENFLKNRGLTNPSRMLLHDDSKCRHLLQNNEIYHWCMVCNKYLMYWNRIAKGSYQQWTQI